MKVTGLFRFPLKSAAAQALDTVHVDGLGLRGDRHWVLTDTDGRFVTARECPALAMVQVHGSRFFFVDSLSPVAEVTDQVEPVSIWKRTQPARRAHSLISEWFSQVLQRPVVLWYLGDREQHFGDSKPVMVLFESTADAIQAELQSEFPALQLRPNILIRGGQPFAESQLPGIQIGPVCLSPIKHCVRCKMINLAPQADRYPEGLPVSRALRTLNPDFVAGWYMKATAFGDISIGDGIE